MFSDESVFKGWITAGHALPASRIEKRTGDKGEMSERNNFSKFLLLVCFGNWRSFLLQGENK